MKLKLRYLRLGYIIHYLSYSEGKTSYNSFFVPIPKEREKYE